MLPSMRVLHMPLLSQSPWNFPHIYSEAHLGIHIVGPPGQHVAVRDAVRGRGVEDVEEGHQGAHLIVQGSLLRHVGRAVPGMCEVGRRRQQSTI